MAFQLMSCPYFKDSILEMINSENLSELSAVSFNAVTLPFVQQSYSGMCACVFVCFRLTPDISSLASSTLNPTYVYLLS